MQPDGVLRCGDRLIILPPLSKEVLEEVQKGHLGVKLKSSARQVCWWPELDADIHTTPKNCEMCLHKVHSKPNNWNP